ncbi:ketoacyl-synthetase C-terminal extension domain-containing protein, partial [Brevibacterium sp. UMB10442]|nr:ketoacyl-synthetase C-terminal extension domain-containing protein [Brevibacterium sp. UMB10442]
MNYTSPNPFIDIENSPFYINTETKYWENSDNNYPRRCGVSSFGIGGTNAHIILEEYVSECKKNRQVNKQNYYPINISADSKESLLKNKNALL